MLHARSSIAKSLVGFAGNRWPESTAKLAFRLFSRVPRQRNPAMPPVLLAGRKPATLQVHGGFVAAWHVSAPFPSGRRALLVHGWNSRSDHMTRLARALLDAGVDVVLLDLPGHGASSGRRMHLGKGVAAVDAAWRNYGPFDAVVGHSFGGVVALNSALGTAMCVPERRPDALVMIAAPDSMPEFFRRFGDFIGLPRRAQEALERKVLHIMGRTLDHFVCSEQLKETDLPVLVVHDGYDRDVPFADGIRMAAAGPHVAFHATNGLGHRRLLKDAGVLDAVTGFVIAGTGSLAGSEPSGPDRRRKPKPQPPRAPTPSGVLQNR